MFALSSQRLFQPCFFHGVVCQHPQTTLAIMSACGKPSSPPPELSRIHHINLPMYSPSSLSLSLCLSFSSFLHDLLSFRERCLSLESSFLLLNHRLPSASVSPTWRQLQEDAQLQNHFHQARKMGILRKPERSEAPERAERVPLLRSRALSGKGSSHPPKRGRSNLKPRTAIPPFVFISQPHHIQAHTNYRRHHRRERQPAHPLSTAGERNKMSC
jgi:hypothetical protein